MARVAAFTDNHARSGGHSSLSHYYTARYGRVVFDKGLREHMVFSDHSLATDSVFAEMHLVSCRNVLIYFERELQDRALGLFRDALCHRGFLGDRKSTRLNSSHQIISYAVFCLKKKKKEEFDKRYRIEVLGAFTSLGLGVSRLGVGCSL